MSMSPELAEFLPGDLRSGDVRTSQGTAPRTGIGQKRITNVFNVPGGRQVQYDDGSVEFIPDAPKVETFRPAQPDPDLERKQTFEREEAERQRQFTAGETEKKHQAELAATERERQVQLQIEQQRQEARRLEQQALQALEQGKLSESRRQFDLSEQRLREAQRLEQERFNERMTFEREQFTTQREQAENEFAFGALKFLTDLARNPRTALASFFLNRGVTPPDAAGRTSPIPAGLNVSNVAEVLPGFLQGIMGAARGGAAPATEFATASAAGAPDGNIVDALRANNALPPFLTRALAQQAGDASQGTSAPQRAALPEGIPLLTPLALQQMSPSEREGLAGLVEASGMSWEDYLDLVRKHSPLANASATSDVSSRLPEFLFAGQ